MLSPALYTHTCTQSFNKILLFFFIFFVLKVVNLVVNLVVELLQIQKSCCEFSSGVADWISIFKMFISIMAHWVDLHGESICKCNCRCKLFYYLQVGTMSSSKSWDQRDHSIRTAVMGCTLCAEQISDAEASDNPKCFTLPSSSNFFISPICST